MLSKEFQDNLNVELGALLNSKASVSEIYSVGGGCINQTFKFSFGVRDFFVKVNSAKKLPGMMDAEAKGLKLLRQINSLVIPEVILQGENEDDQFVVLEYLEQKASDPSYFFNLGKGLAIIHKQTQGKFGLGHNNYIGSLPQDNSAGSDWNEFFISRRIEPLLKQAIDKTLLPKTIHKNFETLFSRLSSVFPNEKPALLHGDLWSGNAMNTTQGPCIFDPAVYYGHREVDIAMTKLFGGFDKDFYSGYNEEFQLEKGWEGRVDILNLYPLLVHVILFGGGYSNDVIRIARKF